MYRLISTLLIINIFTACQPVSKEKKAPVDAFKPDFYTNQETFLMKNPGPDGTPILKLEKGDSFRYQDSTSRFLTRIAKDQQELIEPWYFVLTPDQKKGWIFGGFIEPSKALISWERMRYRHQLAALFGDSLATEIVHYQEAWGKVQQDTDLKKLLQKGQKLPQALLNQITEQGNTPFIYKFVHDSLLPGVIFQDVSSTFFQPFISYKAFLEKAKKTSTAIDDSFFGLCCSLYAPDSIEYYHKIWDFPVSAHEIHSHLGAGHHFASIKRMDTLLRQDSLFRPEILQLKQAWLNSILHQDATFWEDKPALIAELDSILALDLSILASHEIEALEARKQEFRDAENRGILFNLRSGAIR